ncbi:UPF0591 membrane protein [Neolecta irregularis DAH-3]|uniref:UPF0591 membrane protein n=1 Tax=Neolecta irregularis (strain DAH-3) TaxID=1198029 RepID=A0A1U7LW21_NEOID|nr:UPF0591 membrane protein [Neolecta irregularis DAH-3]|eukprot:OLL26875.1 UPF0591 membrane protein [Neolecta irregularis DAH-3]
MSSYLGIGPRTYFPTIRPTALLVGCIADFAAASLIQGPIAGATWDRAMRADKNSEFWRNNQNQNAVATYGASFISSVVQSYAIAALINLTGTVTYKGAASLGVLVFAATSVPSAASALYYEARPLEYVLIKAAGHIVSTVGLTTVLVAWGTRDIQA